MSSLEEKLQSIKRRFAEVQEKLSSPDVASNQQKSKELGKEFRELSEIVKTADRYLRVFNNIQSSKEVLSIGGDAELKELALADIAELEPQLAVLEEEVKSLLVPKDPNDNRNVIVEIRGGTGGEEAALFASDLYRMYVRFCERRKRVGAIEAVGRTLAGHHRQAGAVVLRPQLHGPGLARVGVTRVAQAQRVADLMQQRGVAFAADRNVDHRLDIHPDIAGGVAFGAGQCGSAFACSLLANAEAQLTHRAGALGEFGEVEAGDRRGVGQDVAHGLLFAGREGAKAGLGALGDEAEAQGGGGAECLRGVPAHRAAGGDGVFG